MKESWYERNKGYVYLLISFVCTGVLLLKSDIGESNIFTIALIWVFYTPINLIMLMAFGILPAVVINALNIRNVIVREILLIVFTVGSFLLLFGTDFLK